MVKRTRPEKVWKKGTNMKTKKRILGVLSALVMTGVMLFSANVNAAPPVQSPGTMGRSRAYGSTTYAASSASATTSHAVVSTKTVKVKGFYKIGVSTTYHMSVEAASVTDQPATISLSLPARVVYYVGSKGYHYVGYSTMSWNDVSSVGTAF